VAPATAGDCRSPVWKSMVAAPAFHCHDGLVVDSRVIAAVLAFVPLLGLNLA